ncbi:ATP-binding response regulator [Chitinophaga sancti]|uniref:histidine kinase n=1 Tax=Chitinophaga sancti TaxID=1004 RepID=A0A1K1NDL7_9BACT|nr:hybrid sensor histidine kinase/response regulator [Chitinophaga sancti]WQD63398.1 hybrid sensor histidine kinase/response regulator [Chitinophaga sancti]WQG90976.1 hybrid sensor histidine kinase/response regulator [Chitinophaga sancti]SFW32478.1 Signal transduction histidine kinase [Chitinophaga sancti]
MHIRDTLTTITHTGADVDDLDLRTRIIKVNTMSLVIGLLATFFAWFFYAISGKMEILAAASLEGVAYFSIIWINKKGKYNLGALLAQLIPNLATLYFGIILSAVIEASLLAIFLIGSSFLIIKERKYRVISVSLTVIVLVLLQVNEELRIISPLTFGYTNQRIIHFSAISVVFSLNILIIALYVNQNDILVAELRERGEKLEKANDYKSVFVRETNHEIRVPLNAIHSISQLLVIQSRQQQELAPIRATAEHLCAASYHALEIINNVLELSRIEVGKMHEVFREPFDVRNWIDNIVVTSQYIARNKGVKIALDYDRQQMPAQIDSDKVKLTQIVNNILFNAIKFTADNSTVSIQVSTEKNSCYIRIRDAGKGMEKEQLEKIFDPFTTGKNDFSNGTGLGLHIARHLVSLLGGAITVESIPGKGTSFCIAFPLVAFEGNQPVQPVMKEMPPLPSFTNIRMMIVEDDQMSQIYLTRYLSSLGCHLLTAATGEQALGIMQEQPPDIVLLDSHLPDMDALALLEKFKLIPQLKDIPVIITTGDVFEESRNAMLNAGVAGYVTKPIDFNILTQEINNCLKLPALF